MPTSRSVVIGSPHVLLAEGYDRLLREAGYASVSICSTREALLERIAAQKADLVLLDACFLDAEMTMVHTLVEAGSTVAVTLDLSRNPLLIREAVLAGARGYISIDITLAQFIESLSLMTQGAIVFSGSPGQLVVDLAAAGAPAGQAEPLTNREQELAVLVAHGASNREIADALSISEHTVKVHLGHIRTKLDLRNRQELAAYVARQGMLEDITID
jgi:DNA-binding NarL/FixJ family response regulator